MLKSFLIDGVVNYKYLESREIVTNDVLQGVGIVVDLPVLVDDDCEGTSDLLKVFHDWLFGERRARHPFRLRANKF